jgi:hypothetical protein
MINRSKICCAVFDDHVAHQHTFFVTFRNLKIHNALDITPIFHKLWIFTNLNVVFPIVVLVFDFDDFLEGVLQ